MIRHSLTRNALNFLLFQTGWLVCVMFPGLLAATTALVIVGLHLMLVSQQPASEFRFILVGTVLGSLLDGLWFRVGILFEPGIQTVWTPVWLVGIWAMFMTTLAHSLAWMGKTRWLPFLLAPIAGPFAYWSATQLGSITFPDTLPSLIALGVGWLVLFPSLLSIKRRFFGGITPA